MNETRDLTSVGAGGGKKPKQQQQNTINNQCHDVTCTVAEPGRSTLKAIQKMSNFVLVYFNAVKNETLQSTIEVWLLVLL